MGTHEGNGSAADITVEILKDIRTELRELKATTIEMRGDTAVLKVSMEQNTQGLKDLGLFMRQLALDMTKYERFHHEHVEVIEKDVAELKERVRNLERQRTGGR
jgi:hypothetical protein